MGSISKAFLFVCLSLVVLSMITSSLGAKLLPEVSNDVNENNNIEAQGLGRVILPESRPKLKSGQIKKIACEFFCKNKCNGVCGGCCKGHISKSEFEKLQKSYCEGFCKNKCDGNCGAMACC